MKLSKKKLKEIIKEEIQNVFGSGEYEVGYSNRVWKMETFEEFIRELRSFVGHGMAASNYHIKTPKLTPEQKIELQLVKDELDQDEERARNFYGSRGAASLGKAGF